MSSWKGVIAVAIVCAIFVTGFACYDKGLFDNIEMPWQKNRPDVTPETVPDTTVPIVTPAPTSVPIVKPAPIQQAPAPVATPSSNNSNSNNGWQKWVNYHYFNNDVKIIAPRHFGPDRYEQYQKTNQETLIVYWTRTNFYNSLEIDPCLAAGCIYYAQKVTGENFLGNLEGTTDEEKANYAHYLMRSSPSYWQTAVTNFENYLDNNFAFSVVDINGAYVTSAYMEAGKASFDSKAPKLIWENAQVTQGHWLELSLITGKDNVGKVLRYRMECGYQFPTDGFTSGGKGDPSPNPNPIPTPVPTEQPGKKNPAADPVYQGNANRGGGMNQPADGAGKYQPKEPTVATNTRIYDPNTGITSAPSSSSTVAPSNNNYPSTQPGTTVEQHTTTQGGITTTTTETTKTSVDNSGTVVREVETKVTTTDNSGQSATVKSTETHFDSPIVEHADVEVSLGTDVATGAPIAVTDNIVVNGEIAIPD